VSLPPDKPPGVREFDFADRDALVEVLSVDIHQALAQALLARERVSFVVSGGRSPIPLFRALRKARLPWERVHVTLADERWVPVDDPESNEGLVRRELLQERAAAAHFTGLKTPHPTPQLGLAEAWSRVAALPRPFDVLVLGMGEDGHTASLFPSSPGIDAAMVPGGEPGCAAMSAPVWPNARITLNLAALAASRRAFLHIEGERKREVYRTAARSAAARASRTPDEYPIASMLRLRSPALRVYWAP
jgi:6-phosphogluconolactonase